MVYRNQVAGRATRCVAALAFALVGANAFADVSDVFLRIEATSTAGTGVYEILTNDVTYNPEDDSYSYSGAGIGLWSGATQIGAVNNIGLTVRNDPTIFTNFNLTAGTLPTTFTLTLAQVLFPAINNPDAVASVGLTLSDSDASGSASLSGNAGTGGVNSFVARYNGSSIFAEGIPSISVSSVGGSSAGNLNTGLQTIAGSVSSMQAVLDFDLSARDSASGTGFYVIVPEPAAVVLLAFGVLFHLRRRS